MKCIKCRTVNINKANYCKNCGYHFSKKEQEAAKKWSFVWFLEKIDKVKSLWKFSFITDHILFKIASVAIVLGIGIYSCFANGTHLKILKTDEYQLQYNKDLKEYYLLTDNDQTKLNIYIPNQISEISIQQVASNDQIISEATYKKEQDIILVNTEETDYYLIKVKDSPKENLKIYIYRKDDEDEA